MKNKLNDREGIKERKKGLYVNFISQQVGKEIKTVCPHKETRTWSILQQHRFLLRKVILSKG